MSLVDPAPLWPPLIARRELGAVEPRAWFDAYVALVADVRREVRAELRSFDPAHGWRGCADLVLLRNPYADVGITTWQGIASVWMTERDDAAYRLRCEWTDISVTARAWLTEVTPRFDAIAARIGCVPDPAAIPAPIDWLKAA